MIKGNLPRDGIDFHYYFGVRRNMKVRYKLIKEQFWHFWVVTQDMLIS